MTARRVLYAILALVLIAVGVDAAYWKWAADRMRHEIKAWVADRTAEGWQIAFDRPEIGGWPLAVRAHLTDVSVSQGRTVALRLAGVGLSVRLLEPTTLMLDFLGEQTIKAGAEPAVVLAGSVLSAEIPLPDPSGRPVILAGRDLRVRSEGWTARIAGLDGHVTVTGPSVPVEFGVVAEGIDLPNGEKWPLGPTVASVSVAGALNGALPPLNPTAAWATAWRDGGGSVDVKQAAIQWGPLTLTSTATLALDDQLQPMGSGSAKASGYTETLDRMAKAGLLTKSAATVAKAMLSLLAGTGDGDTPLEVEVPLTLQYRTLSMRQVPLVRLPELDWPER
jgi:hypothetical protein